MEIEKKVGSSLDGEICKNTIKEALGLIKPLIISSIVLPSWDVYSDLAFTFQMFKDGNPLYGISTLIPQISNIIFNSFSWNRFENHEHRRWSWIFVIIQCWPQFFAARIVLKIMKRRRIKVQF